MFKMSRAGPRTKSSVSATKTPTQKMAKASINNNETIIIQSDDEDPVTLCEDVRSLDDEIGFETGNYGSLKRKFDAPCFGPHTERKRPRFLSDIPDVDMDIESYVDENKSKEMSREILNLMTKGYENSDGIIFDMINYAVEIQEKAMNRGIDFYAIPLKNYRKSRAMFIDWLSSVVVIKVWLCETFQRTIQLIDMAVPQLLEPDINMNRVSNQFQLISMAALWISTKIEQRYVPGVKDVVGFGGGAFTAQELFDMEKKLIKTLDFQLNIPEPAFWARLFADWSLQTAGINPDGELNRDKIHDVRNSMQLCCALLAQQPVIYYRYTPSQIALGSLRLVCQCYDSSVLIEPPALVDLLGKKAHQEIATRDITSLCAAVFLKAPDMSPGIWCWFSRARFHKFTRFCDWHSRCATTLHLLAKSQLDKVVIGRPLPVEAPETSNDEGDEYLVRLQEAFDAMSEIQLNQTAILNDDWHLFEFCL